MQKRHLLALTARILIPYHEHSTSTINDFTKWFKIRTKTFINILRQRIFPSRQSSDPLILYFKIHHGKFRIVCKSLSMSTTEP